MENSEGQGYISEKKFDSFIAGIIPIYYGGYMIDEYINPKSFILIKNEKDILKKIEYIKQFDNDEKLYEKILNEKLFINDNLISTSEIKKAEFFSHIFEQKQNKAKRIDNYHFNSWNITIIFSELSNTLNNKISFLINYKWMLIVEF